MTSGEAKAQQERLVIYNKLVARREQRYAAKDAINKDDPNGPHGQGPFTMNTRESRNVDSITVYFSATKGGSPPVNCNVHYLGIPAYKLAGFLNFELDAIIGQIDKEISKL